MEDLDIPIFKKSYDLYKDFYALRNGVPRQDKFAIWLRCENLILEVLESIVAASQLSKLEKLPILQKGSIKLNFLRIFLRLAKEIKLIDNNKYLISQEEIDEIGRMLGGWIKSTKVA